MIVDLDNDVVSSEEMKAHMLFVLSVRKFCEPGVHYDYVDKFTRTLVTRDGCRLHGIGTARMTAIRLADGSGLFTYESQKALAKAVKERCIICYIDEFSNYSEMHGFTPFLTGTIAQIRYATKIRAKAHMRHAEKTRRAVIFLTEPKWWLENNQRMHLAKIWREVSEMTDQELIQLNEKFAADREGQEDRRVKKVLGE